MPPADLPRSRFDADAPNLDPDARRVIRPEPEVVLDHDQARAIAIELAESRDDAPRPSLINYNAAHPCLAHPFVDEHGPEIAKARDHLASIVEGSRIEHERYAARTEAHKAEIGAWCAVAILAFMSVNWYGYVRLLDDNPELFRLAQAGAFEDDWLFLDPRRPVR